MTEQDRQTARRLASPLRGRRGTSQGQWVAIAALASAFVFSSFSATAWAGTPPFEAAPPIGQILRVSETQSNSELSFEDVVAASAGAQLVFVGETHLDESTHRAELAIYEALLDATNNEVTLSLEMFERDVQPVLDRYLAGEIDESDFLKSARPWGNYRTDYRPLIELAKSRGVPVVAANMPVAHRRRIMQDGRAAYDALRQEFPSEVPRELRAALPSYWERFERSVRGHAAAFLPESDEDRLLSTQSLWDNAMGEACVDALGRQPEHVVLHIAGGFHTRYREGTVYQAVVRKPDAKVIVIDLQTTRDLPGLVFATPDAGESTRDEGLPESAGEAGEDSETPIADFIVHVDERARSAFDGRRAVRIGREAEYRLSRGRTGGTKPTGILALASTGAAADVTHRWLRAVFGENPALATIDPLYPVRSADLGDAGTWWRKQHFDGDLFQSVGAVVRIAEHVCRTEGIAPEDLTIFGEGEAGTVVAALAMYTAAPFGSVIALEPSGMGGLAELALPDSSSERPPLELYAGAEADREWWRKEIDAREDTGLRARVAGLDMAAELFLQPASEARVTRPTALRVDSPRARAWARTSIARSSGEFRFEPPVLLSSIDANESGLLVVLAVEGEPLAEFEPAFRPESFDAFGEVPEAPGSFGGTTLLVGFPGLDPELRERWLALETRRLVGRFSQVKVAFPDASPTIAEVLESIRSSGRRNVLVCPVAYCASADEMRALETAVREHDPDAALELHFTPGLGSTTDLTFDRP